MYLEREQIVSYESQEKSSEHNTRAHEKSPVARRRDSPVCSIRVFHSRNFPCGKTDDNSPKRVGRIRSGVLFSRLSLEEIRETDRSLKILVLRTGHYLSPGGGGGGGGGGSEDFGLTRRNLADPPF